MGRSLIYHTKINSTRINFMRSFLKFYSLMACVNDNIFVVNPPGLSTMHTGGSFCILEESADNGVFKAISLL